MLSEIEAVAQIKQALLEHGKIRHATITPSRVNYYPTRMTIKVTSIERRVARDYLTEVFGDGEYMPWITQYNGLLPDWLTYYSFKADNPIALAILNVHKGFSWRIPLDIRD